MNIFFDALKESLSALRELRETHSLRWRQNVDQRIYGSAVERTYVGLFSYCGIACTTGDVLPYCTGLLEWAHT